jgi:CheY-like chemotaxis protein
MLARKEMRNRLPGMTPHNQRRVRETRRIRKVLVVDDSPSLAYIIRQMLEVEGYQTQAAYDGQLGYRAYLDFRPDLIITDVHMTGQSGPELIRQVRKHELGIRTIYVSGYPDIMGQCLDDEGGRHPACYFLQKPFSRGDLLRVIAQFNKQDQSR